MTEILQLVEISSDEKLESDMNIKMQKISEFPILEDDKEEIFIVTKKRIQTFSDSESDLDKENDQVVEKVNLSNNSEKSFDKEEVIIPHKATNKRFRIKNIQNSDSDNEESSDDVNSNAKQKHYESVRTENKKQNLREKFKNLISSKFRETENISQLDSNDTKNLEEDTYCLEIKQILRTSVNSMKSICDPDTSEEDSSGEEKMNKKKHKSKKMKSTSPKPMRMSTKQAMENMKKIKSESNRMLREKTVSLPYHRPKALSLKDIMSRRKPAVTSDGKALPIKMNDEQLKQYAMMLEQRQKEVIELCKSDTDDEQNEENDREAENNFDDLQNNINIESTNSFQNALNEDNLNKLNIGKENSNYDLKQSDTPNNETIKENNFHSQTSEEIQIAEEKKEVGNNTIYNKINEQKENVCMSITNEDEHVQQNNVFKKGLNSNIEDESQVMALHYDSEKVNSVSVLIDEEIHKDTKMDQLDTHEFSKNDNNSKDEDSFEDELNYDEIDKFISDAEILSKINKKTDESLVVNATIHVNSTPKLTGSPGSFINLDESDPLVPRKLSGVEILKERFTYFAKLNTSEEMDKDREKKYKPGTQHLKLKQELEQQIAEQRSMEWEKRLEEEKQLKSEILVNGELSDDDIEKIEAKLEIIEAKDKKDDIESSESEEEPIENDIILEDKPKKRNPMVDDEAEESECDDDVIDEKDDLSDAECKDADVGDEADLEDEDDESSDSSESEDENESKPRKGRILKAFEDSDDESTTKNQDISLNYEQPDIPSKVASLTIDDNEIIKETQDEDLQLAQANKSSVDLFSTQESLGTLNKNNKDNISADLGTQSFSIMNSGGTNLQTLDLNSPEKLSVVCSTQSQEDLNLDHVVGMCSGSFSQSIVSLQNPPPLSQSQEIGDDVAALCTGKFYDNPFVSQVDNKNRDEEQLQQPVPNRNSQSQEIGDDVAALCTGKFYDNPLVSQNCDNDIKLDTEITKSPEQEQKCYKEKTILKSILDELDEPELDVPRQNKYFINTQPKDTVNIEGINLKKKFVIDSDDENDNTMPNKKIKKLKKRKSEHRALQISDDEEEDLEEDEDYFDSEREDEDRIVEYDSEENEVEVQVKPLKKKRVGEFFENEAELTSEDEWVGSGDEDEKGLDRMEREEGDNDVFHQGQLQRELGQIHMREVLDQDKREVRLLQELLFEDGDLGDGHRQRKFRWRNADGEIETGTNPDELPDTQEDEFESEEQWRKQRHEREMFLRKMQEKDQENLDTSINRTTIIKANLNSRSMTSLISETKTSITEKIDITVPEKKSTKDMPSPKKPFTIFQQNYHNSLLTRGRGALARLAALATPLATDNDDAPKLTASTNRRNFVFAAVTTDKEPKVAKRKADQIKTPKLIKKLKTEETSKYIKNSLFDHLKT